MAANLDLDNIITPVKVNILEELLEETGYDQNKKDYLVKGFRNGFSLEYNGSLNNCQRKTPQFETQSG